MNYKKREMKKGMKVSHLLRQAYREEPREPREVLANSLIYG
jgi:hypothetical protein